MKTWKKFALTFFGVIFVITFTMNCGSIKTSKPQTIPINGQQLNEQKSLSVIIRNAVTKIENDIGPGNTIAVYDFKSPTEEFSNFVVEELLNILANNKILSIVERNRLAVVRTEVDYQFSSGEVSDDEIISISQGKGANFIITGHLDFDGLSWIFRIYAIDANKRMRIASTSIDIDVNDKQLIYFFGGRIKNSYKIGDIGPAGGLVFYDKGNFSNGWRYMEAAPIETEFSARWGAEGQVINGLGTPVGFGKKNTQLIIEYLNQTQGEVFKIANTYDVAWKIDECAAYICVSINFDGFKDWFLPSKDELNLMYKNLAQKGFGDFPQYRGYWSSSKDFIPGDNSHNPWYQSFTDGSQDEEPGYLIDEYYVRAIRQF